MRWKTALLSTVCLVFAAGIARAETNWVGIYGGLGMPTGDFSDAASTGYDFGATGTWMFAPTWGVGVDVAYFSWSGSDDIEATGDDWTFSAVQATGHGLFMIPTQGNMHPWLKGGLGMYNMKASVDYATPPGGSADDSESNFGFNVGGGIDMATSPTMRVGVGAAYHIIQTDPDATNLFTVDLHVRFGMGGPQ